MHDAAPSDGTTIVVEGQTGLHIHVLTRAVVPELLDHEERVEILPLDPPQAVHRILPQRGDAEYIPVWNEPVVEGPGRTEGDPVVDGG